MDPLEKINRDFMARRGGEVKLLMRILAIAGLVILLVLLAGYIFIRIKSPQMLQFSKNIKEYQVSLQLDSLSGARFITGMNASENILLADSSRDFYVSCLDGHIHRLSTDSLGEPSLASSFKAGTAAMGLALENNGDLLAAVSNHPLKEWKTKGGAVCRISHDFSQMRKITGDYPSMNGLCVDNQGNIYFASSNFNFFNPLGTVFRMTKDVEGEYIRPEAWISDAGLANGLYYDDRQSLIYFSNTLGGVYTFSSTEPVMQEVYLKLRFMEACDDLCTDIAGNVWMTDPGYSTVKMYNPGTGVLARFIIQGIGQTSSCRIRSEHGKEMIYLTELKKDQKPMSDVYDGRGVLIVPAQALIRLLEPQLIKE